jgi:DNA primase
VQIAGREVQITNPDKVFFPLAGYTKGDLLEYYLAVAEGAVRGVSNRPMALKRFVQGAEGEAFFQKRAPANRPDWIETAMLSFGGDHLLRFKTYLGSKRRAHQS